MYEALSAENPDSGGIAENRKGIVTSCRKSAVQDNHSGGFDKKPEFGAGSPVRRIGLKDRNGIVSGKEMPFRAVAEIGAVFENAGEFVHVIRVLFKPDMFRAHHQFHFRTDGEFAECGGAEASAGTLHFRHAVLKSATLPRRKLASPRKPATKLFTGRR